MTALLAIAGLVLLSALPVFLYFLYRLAQLALKDRR